MFKAVSKLLQQRRSESLTETVKLISSLQGELADKQAEADEVRRSLDHLTTPVQNALRDYATALQELERCQLAVHQLQAQQYFLRQRPNDCARRDQRAGGADYRTTAELEANV